MKDQLNKLGKLLDKADRLEERFKKNAHFLVNYSGDVESEQTKSVVQDYNKNIADLEDVAKELGSVRIDLTSLVFNRIIEILELISK